MTSILNGVDDGTYVTWLETVVRTRQKKGEAMGGRKIKSLAIVGLIVAFAVLSLHAGCAKETETNELAGDESLAIEPAKALADDSKPELTETREALMPEITTDLQIYNLQKLCKVWGYVKYTHSAFLLGQKDWDEELLKLMPGVSLAENKEDVNDILYDWFMGLGENDYDTPNRVITWVAAQEEDKNVQADTRWISEKDYLGDGLSGALSQMQVIPNVNRKHAPVYFNELGGCVFDNEKTYLTMDYGDVRYRLLGLFRFWNAIEYYFPYLDTLDDDWNECLLEYIPLMAEDADKQSYDRTLASISTKLKDAHTMYQNSYFLTLEFGKYRAPVVLVKAEGRIVVKEGFEVGKAACPLMAGDVILKVDGKDIGDIIEDRKQIMGIPNDDKIMKILGPYLLVSHNNKMEVTILRDNEEMSISVPGYEDFFRSTYQASFEILNNNIGVLNPSMLPPEGIQEVMEELSGTEGLIIDLRQYPSFSGMAFQLSEYLFDKKIIPFIFSKPSVAVPGTFVNQKADYYGWSQDSAVYQYKKKVVLLVDEGTWSSPETAALVLRNGTNVTVMGENSMGGNGDIVLLPLPGGKTISFSGFGMYTRDGGQTQRIGIVPDIQIERTIEGIKEGRDEYLEAAIQYIIRLLDSLP